MTYGIQTLTITDQAGNIDRLLNPSSSGQVLLSTGTTTSPDWKTLAQANIAAADAYLPLTGGTLTGALTGTSASFSSTVTATGGFSGDLSGTATNAAKVANALSIQLGTNTAQTYDGSGVVSVQVTPTAIGAALASHEHSLSDITSGWPNDHGLLFHDTNSTTTPPTILANPTMSTATAGLYFPAQSVGSASREFGWQKMPLGVLISQETTSAGGTVRSLTSAVGSTQNTFLKYTGTGYEFAPIGSAIVPPITSLQSASSDTEAGTPTQNKNQTVLFRAESYTGNPNWRLIDGSDIYGAPQNNLSVLVSDGTGAVDTYGCPGRWHNIATSDISTTPKIFAAKTVSSNPTLDFFSASDLGLVTSIPNIKGLEVGEASTANKVLLGNASATGTPSWAALKDINTGLSAGIAKIDSNGKLTSNPTVSLATEVTGNILDIAPGSTNEGYLLAVGATTSGGTTTYHPTWVAPTSVKKTFTISSTGWYRIARSRYSSIGTFKFSNIPGGVKYSCEFIAAVNNGTSPQINQLIWSDDNINNDIELQSARIVYKLGDYYNYLEIYVRISAENSINFELSNFSGWELLTPTAGSDESASGFNVLSYRFSMSAWGENNQVLTTSKTTSTDTTTNTTTDTVRLRWTTLPDIPSAPSSLPLVDNETGALGTAGTYANADHQHPLPYSVTAAKKLYTARRIGIGGAVTAVSQEFDGTGDILLITENIDPNYILGTIPISKIPTGTSSSTVALGNHTHSTYLPKAGGNMTGAINFPASLTTPVTWPEHSGIAYFGAGELSVINDVSFAVKGNTEFRQIFEADFQESGASEGVYQKRVDLVHTNHKNTVYNIACGEGSQINNFVRNIKLPSPTADNLGDKLTIYFTKKTSQYNGSINATCATTSRLMKFDYTSTSSLTWSNGNIVEFVCVQVENNGSDYFWRAIKLVEQKW